MAGETPPENVVFNVRLPQFSAAAYQEAFAAAAPDEKPTQMGFLLAQAFDETRIPYNVNVGSATIREGTLLETDGWVYAIGCEGDRDYHIDIVATSDMSGRATCFVAEIPWPAYMATESLANTVQRARHVGATLRKGDHVRLVGQFFYDAWHMPSSQAALNANPGGGRGASHCAGTLWEIHPTLSITQI